MTIAQYSKVGEEGGTFTRFSVHCVYVAKMVTRT